MMHCLYPSRHLTLVAFVALALAPACDEPLAEGAELEAFERDGDPAGGPDEFTAPNDPVYTYNGWTPWTSDELPPVGCDPGSLVGQFGCSGSWCDNVRLDCVPTGQSAGGSYWTGYFSEEGYNYRLCASGSWMSGIACKGGWCDNVAIQCTSYPGITAKDCFWTGWISEEGGGTLTFGPGMWARGAQCSGSRCDNMRFMICRY
jgi:hypothetical protein